MTKPQEPGVGGGQGRLLASDLNGGPIQRRVHQQALLLQAEVLLVGRQRRRLQRNQSLREILGTDGGAHSGTQGTEPGAGLAQP